LPKIRLRRLVAVFAHGQSIRTTPLCYIPREDAEWWIASGGAEAPRGYGRCIVLNKIKSLEIRGASAKMGMAVLDGISNGGSRFHEEILKRWRFGFVEPARAERTTIRAMHFAAPACAEA
jgi:hypothetical protein